MRPESTRKLAVGVLHLGVGTQDDAGRGAVDPGSETSSSDRQPIWTSASSEATVALHSANRGRAEHTFAFERKSDRLEQHRAYTADAALERPKARPEAPVPAPTTASDRSAQLTAIADSRSNSIDAGERRLRSWRRLGLALERIPLHRGGRPRRDQSPNGTGNPRLIELGISKNQATRARSLAGLSDGDFEAYLAAARVDGANVTVGGALRHAAVASGVQNPTNPVDPGTRGLREFRRDLNAAPHVADDLEVLEQSEVLLLDGVFQRPIEGASEPDVAAARAALADEGVAQ